MISVDDLRPGMRLGRTLYDGSGRSLLNKGAELREGYIDKLRRYVSVVYIEDEVSEGIELPEVVPAHLRLEMQRLLSEQWQRVRNSLVSEASFEPSFSRSLRSHVVDLLDIVERTPCIHEDMASLASFDNHTYSHSINVAVYAMAVGLGLGLTERALLDLGVGAILHDVGKIWVPLKILNKPGELTNEEFAEMKRHTEYGHAVLSRHAELSYVVGHCAFQHHERLNGGGYPRGLAGDQIHPYAQIIAVADVYDALVAHRPYRAGWTPADAAEYLFSRAGTDFSVELVRQFSLRVSLYPVGSEVRLSDGRRAVVARVNEGMPSRPVVRALNMEGSRVAGVEEIDLAERLNITVVRAGETGPLRLLD